MLSLKNSQATLFLFSALLFSSSIRAIAEPSRSLEAAYQLDWTKLSTTEKEERISSAKPWLDRLAKETFATVSGDISKFGLEATALGGSQIRRRDYIREPVVYLKNESKPYRGHSYSASSNDSSPRESNRQDMTDGSTIVWRERLAESTNYLSPLFADDTKLLLQVSPEDTQDVEHVRSYLLLERLESPAEALSVTHIKVDTRTGNVLREKREILEKSDISAAKLRIHTFSPLKKAPSNEWDSRSLSLPLGAKAWQMHADTNAKRKALSELERKFESYSSRADENPLAHKQLLQVPGALKKAGENLAAAKATASAAKAEFDAKNKERSELFNFSTPREYLEALRKQRAENEQLEIARKELSVRTAARDAALSELEPWEKKINEVREQRKKYLSQNRAEIFNFLWAQYVAFGSYDPESSAESDVKDLIEDGVDIAYMKRTFMEKDRLTKTLKELKAEKQKVDAEIPYFTWGEEERITARKEGLANSKELQARISVVETVLSLLKAGKLERKLDELEKLFGSTVADSTYRKLSYEQETAHESYEEQAAKVVALTRSIELRGKRIEELKPAFDENTKKGKVLEDGYAAREAHVKETAEQEKLKSEELSKILAEASNHAQQAGLLQAEWDGKPHLVRLTKNSESSPGVQNYTMDIFQPEDYQLAKRAMVSIQNDDELGDSVNIFSFSPDDKTPPVESIRFLPHMGKATTSAATIPEFLNPREMFLQRGERKLLGELKSFPNIVHALQRMGLTHDKLNLADTNVVYLPEAFTHEKTRDASAFVTNDKSVVNPASLGLNDRSQWSDAVMSHYILDNTVFSIVPLKNLDREFDDVLLHELVHVLQSKNQNVVQPAPAKSFEEELPRFKQSFRESKQYQDAWKSFARKNQVEISQSNEKQQKAAKELFESGEFGADLERVSVLWRKQFDYVTSPSEDAAWRAQISYLKHEKAMTFDQIKEHLARASGATKESADLSTVMGDRLKTWFLEAK